MRVSRLQVHGFKSFASPASLELGPGITAVVGPNGSGKSNLVDAVRLVLGGASARELRGQRLEQVIFSGGERRAALGMAEVTIVFDNEDGRLPVDDVEVALTRRVYRDGTSEFRRNGQRVRLRDLGRLLDATGLAQAGYAVIAQNDIESIIRATPAQRRHLVEEAAGVRGAQVLIADSRLRMQELDRWLEGSVGRLAELMPRIAELRLQAGTAEDAGALKVRLLDLRGSLERAAWLGALADARRLDRQLAGARRRHEEAARSFADYEAHYLRERQRLQEAQAGRLEQERLLGQTALKVQQLETAVERWTERAQQAASARETARAQLLEVGADLASLGERELDGAGADLDAIAEARTARDALAQQLATIERGRADLRRDLATAEVEVAKLGTQAVELARQQGELEVRLRSLAERLGHSAPLAAEIAARLAATRQQLGSVQEQSLARQAAAELETAELDRSVRAEAAALDVLRAAEQAVGKVITVEREISSRAAAHEAILAERRQGRPLAEAVSVGALRLQSLSSTVHPVQEADAPAVEAALGVLAAALIGSEEDARQALAMAGGVAEVVCWPVPVPVPGPLGPPPIEQNGCRPLVSVLSGDPAALEMVRRLCVDVCLAESRMAAGLWLARVPGGRAVLADGTVLGVGFEITSSAAEGEMRATQRLNAIRADLRRQQGQVREAESHLQWAQDQHWRQRGRVDQARERTAKAVADATSTQELETRLAELVRELAQRSSGVEAELASDRAQLKEGDRQLASLLERAKLLAESQEIAQEQFRKLTGMLTDLAGPELTVRDALEQARLKLAETEMQQRARADRAREDQERRVRLLERGRTARSRLDTAEKAAVVALAIAQEARSELSIAAATRGRLSRPGSPQDATASDPLQQLAHLERGRAELESQLAQAAAASHSLERELYTLRDRAQRLRDQVGADSDEAALEDRATLEDPERVAQEISRLERRLQALGPVNELAPIQLQDLLERTEGLRAAHDDTAAARGDIEAVAARLGEIVEGRFRETMASVAGEFESTWKELFGGGRAKLRLTDGGPGEAGGVDLEVQPQGKRVIPMAMLSGGERALTALALILALQQVSPSPFYVFDEVDAALDEANVANFARLLSTRAARSQFLVITHSLTTMARASHLYGVTQDGRGSSRVLSVRLSADGRSVEGEAGEQMAEALVGS